MDTKSNRKSENDFDKDFVNVNINILKEKKAIFHDLKARVFENNGVIFGGMVRDEIISEHNKSKFDKFRKTEEGKKQITKNFSIDFWNKNIHSESAKRTLVANDMDVFFSNEDDKTAFCENLMKNFTDIIIVSTGNVQYTGILSNIKHDTVTISFNMGKTFTYKGINLDINIDILTGSSAINLEPPFNNADMLCNMFIEDKTRVKRLSMNTGTYIDKFNMLEKTIATAKIIKDITEYKTEICNKYLKSIVTRDYAIKRYNKMIKNGWTIKNLPYEVVNKTHNSCIDIDCCICCDSFADDNEDVQIVITKNGSKTHHDCFIKYMCIQMDNYSPKLVCPYKGNINYTNIRVNDWSYYKTF